MIIYYSVQLRCTMYAFLNFNHSTVDTFLPRRFVHVDLPQQHNISRMRNLELQGLPGCVEICIDNSYKEKDIGNANGHRRNLARVNVKRYWHYSTLATTKLHYRLEQKCCHFFMTPCTSNERGDMLWKSWINTTCKNSILSDKIFGSVNFHMQTVVSNNFHRRRPSFYS